jgi:hypothetical protein
MIGEFTVDADGRLQPFQPLQPASDPLNLAEDEMIGPEPIDEAQPEPAELAPVVCIFTGRELSPRRLKSAIIHQALADFHIREIEG